MKNENLLSVSGADLLSGSGASALPLLLKVPEVSRLLGLGRTKVYEMVGAGELPVFRCGTSVRVPRLALEKWIEMRTEKAA